MSTLQKLQDWYRSECDGEWEHGCGVSISTLDNPGWSVTIDLDGTSLEGRRFEAVSYGVGKDAVEGSDDWLDCRVEEKRFQGRGGPRKLEEILEIFMRWKVMANQSVDSAPGNAAAPSPLARGRKTHNKHYV